MCAVYEGQQVVLSERELQQERSELPVLPPSLFGQNATCRCCRTADQVVQQYGAVHGQRVQGENSLLLQCVGAPAVDLCGCQVKPV